MYTVERNYYRVLFQENKSYGVETICVDPLLTLCYTSHCEHPHLYLQHCIHVLISICRTHKLQQICMLLVKSRDH
jgi:hypothetical protein